jgi:chemotaxis protein methyltransferase WspC
MVQAHGEKSGAPLRVLSAPCANGEEPYSIAITLLEAGLPADAFTIDAIDLSLTGLALAKTGRYRTRSLREVNPVILKKYFLACGDDTYQVNDAVKLCVTYRHANILDVVTVDPLHSYDIIFSRNVLIYMSKPAREQVIEGFSRLLTSDGLLFVGHAESGLLFDREFISAGDLGCFAFTKKPAMLENDHRAKAKTSLQTPPSSAAATQLRAAAALAVAKQLADQGRYEEAKPQVSAVLDYAPDSAEAEHLMGLICAASGQLVDASRHFERSLYLQPNHRASVEHLSLVMDARDKAQVASRLRDKMARMDADQ